MSELFWKIDSLPSTDMHSTVLVKLIFAKSSFSMNCEGFSYYYDICPYSCVKFYEVLEGIILFKC